jgi:hypothetical protein
MAFDAAAVANNRAISGSRVSVAKELLCLVRTIRVDLDLLRQLLVFMLRRSNPIILAYIYSRK